MATCACALAGAGEPQEMCSPAECDWAGPLVIPCVPRGGRALRVASCACPAENYLFALDARSNVPRLALTAGEGWAIAAAWAATFSVPLLLALLGARAPRFYARARRAALPAGVAKACAAATCAVVALASLKLVPGHQGLLDCGREGTGMCTYHSMFCEPSRRGAGVAVRHPVNTWSNLPYLYAGILSFGFACQQQPPQQEGGGASILGRYARALDACFGCFVLALFACSFLWHATNCNAVHYFDLATMDCVILFFPLRYLFLLLARLLARPRAAGDGKDEAPRLRLSAARAHALGAAALAGAALMLATRLRKAQAQFDAGDFDQGFPTGAARSVAAAGGGEGSLSGAEVASLALPPVFYAVLPTLVALSLRDPGDLRAAVSGAAFLACGWVLHLGERWAFAYGPCFGRGPLASVVQATGWFHLCTGATVLCALLHVKSLDALVAAALRRGGEVRKAK